jgi:hypothetical protein
MKIGMSAFGTKRTSQIRPVIEPIRTCAVENCCPCKNLHVYIINTAYNHWLGVCRVCCAAFSMT